MDLSRIEITLIERYDNLTFPNGFRILKYDMNLIYPLIFICITVIYGKFKFKF